MSETLGGMRQFPQLTPRSVLEFRHEIKAIVKLIPLDDIGFRFYRTIRVPEGYEVYSSRAGDDHEVPLMNLIDSADVVLWSPQIIELSATGSEIFEEKKLPNDLHHGTELWFMSEGQMFGTPHPKELEVPEGSQSPFILCHCDEARFFYFGSFTDGINRKQYLRGYIVDRRENDVDPLTAPLVASWLFLRTKVVDVIEHHPTRGVQKHWARRNIEIPRVKTVVLRTSEPSVIEINTPGRSVEYSHRWLVRPHWRNQYIPSRKDHEPRFIEAYVKGPEGKPLVRKDVVFAAKR